MGIASHHDGLRITDSELAFIAANAAIEVDDLIQGHDDDITNVQKLSELIKQTVTHSEDHDTPVKSLMDPISTDAFTKALASSRYGLVGTIEELVAITEELSIKLAEVKAGEDNLEKIRDFCVALSKNALSLRHALYQAKTNNPNQK